MSSRLGVLPFASSSCAVSSMPGVQIAALQRVALLERILQVGDLAGVGHAFDGLDLGAVALHREHETAAHHLAVHPHRAGAADAVLAADMAAGQAQIFAQEIDQRLARLDARGRTARR